MLPRSRFITLPLSAASFPSRVPDFAFAMQARRSHPAVSSSSSYGTGLSPPVTPHHASLRRSFVQLQAGERLPGVTFTTLYVYAPRRTLPLALANG